MHLLLLPALLLAVHVQAAPPSSAAREARANPIFIRNPEDITSGDILAGTAGTIGGERLPLRMQLL
jgi:hypothetical protein